MRALGALTLAASGLALLAPSGASARVGRHVTAVAFAGPGVYAAWDTGRRTEVRTGSRARGGSVVAVSRRPVYELDGSPEAVAATASVFGEHSPVAVLAGRADGSRLRAIARCARREPLAPVEVAVAGPVVAETVSGCATSAPRGARQVTLHDVRDGTVRVLHPPRRAVVVGVAGRGTNIAVASWIPSDGPRATYEVEVVDAASGTPRYAVGGLPADWTTLAAPLAVDEAGRVAFCVGDRLAWASPAEPRPHRLGRARCELGLRFAGDRVATQDSSVPRLEVVGLDARSRALVRPFASDDPFDWDGTHALLAEYGVPADRLRLQRPRDPVARPPRHPLRILAARVGPRGRTLLVTLACPAAARRRSRPRPGPGRSPRPAA
jgi:hypothetical protein